MTLSRLVGKSSVSFGEQEVVTLGQEVCPTVSPIKCTVRKQRTGCIQAGGSSLTKGVGTSLPLFLCFVSPKKVSC